MKAKLWGSIFFGIGLSLIAPGTYAADTSSVANREWVKTAVQDQLNHGKANEAVKILQDHLAKDNADAEAWAQLAFIQSRTDSCNEAQSSLLRAAKVGSFGAQSIYLQAAEQLKTKGCASLSQEQLTSSKSEMAEVELAGSVGLRVGHDSNVMLLSDGQVSAQSSASAFLNPTAQINYAKKKTNGILNLNSVSSYTGYTGKEVESFNNFYQSFGIEWRPEKAQNSEWAQSFGNRVDLSFVNSDSLKYLSGTDTFYGSFSKSLNTNERIGFDFSMGIQNYAPETAPTSNDRRDGFLLNPSVWYSKRLSQHMWTSALTLNSSTTRGDNYFSSGATLITGISGDISMYTRYRTSIAYTQTNYEKHIQGREDKRIDASVNLAYTLPSKPQWSLVGEVLHSNNQSTLSNLSYNRSSVTGQVIYAF